MTRSTSLFCFTILLLVTESAAAFGSRTTKTKLPFYTITSSSATSLFAEGGPQYNKRPGSVVFNKEVGRGSYLIRVAAEDDEIVDYEPGHVLAFEMLDPEKTNDDDNTNKDDKWMRGPYTVTRSDDSTFDVLYRVVGKKTEAYTTLKTSSATGLVRFGGKFKVPILKGIDPTSKLERIVLVSTGVGIGPQIGFIEQVLVNPAFNDVRRVDLYAGFRETEDVCCPDVLDALVAAHPERFAWTPVLSSEEKSGRTSDAPNLARVVADGGGENNSNNAGATHYHLIGNGSMVNEWKAGLEKAGVPDNRVTLEMYFNHKESPRPEIVEAIGVALKEEETANVAVAAAVANVE